MSTAQLAGVDSDYLNQMFNELIADIERLTGHHKKRVTWFVNQTATIADERARRRAFERFIPERADPSRQEVIRADNRGQPYLNQNELSEVLMRPYASPEEEARALMPKSLAFSGTRQHIAPVYEKFVDWLWTTAAYKREQAEQEKRIQRAKAMLDAA